jgi:hypothetical protein
MVSQLYRSTHKSSGLMLSNTLVKMKSENMLKKAYFKLGLPYLSTLPCTTPSEDQERIIMLQKRIADERGRILCAAKLTDRLNKKRLIVREMIHNAVVPETPQALHRLRQRVATARNQTGGPRRGPYIGLPTTQPHPHGRCTPPFTNTRLRLSSMHIKSLTHSNGAVDKMQPHFTTVKTTNPAGPRIEQDPRASIYPVAIPSWRACIISSIL